MPHTNQISTGLFDRVKSRLGIALLVVGLLALLGFAEFSRRHSRKKHASRRSPMRIHPWAHPLYTVAGDFDPMTMTIEIKRTLRRAETAYSSAYRVAMAKVSAGQLTEAEVEEYLRGRPEFDLYLRVRVHERAHYFQYLATSTGIAQVMLYGDRLINLVEALRGIEGDGCVRIPLRRWVEVPDHAAPDTVDKAVLEWFLTERIMRALSGHSELLSDPKDESFARFRSLFDTLEERERLAGFTFGHRVLAEGAAIAAEWLYVLRQDPARAAEAHDDIVRNPAEYRLAYEYVAEACPGLEVASYLQTLCVLADMALHAPVDPDAWPVYGVRPRKPIRVEPEFAPGVRFVRLVAALARRPPEDWRAKDAIADVLMSKIRALGWSTPRDITQDVLEHVNESLKLEPSQTLTPVLGEQHPMLRMRRALEIRHSNPLAFVAPVDNVRINAANIAPPGTFGSRIDRPPPQEVLLRATQTYRHELVDQLLNNSSIVCPLATAWSAIPSDDLNFVPGWKGERRRHRFHSSHCPPLEREMVNILGPNWRARLQPL